MAINRTRADSFRLTRTSHICTVCGCTPSLEKGSTNPVSFSTTRFPRIFRARPMLLFAALLWLTTAAYCIDGKATEAHWVGSWATSQQLVEPGNALKADDLRDATLRQIVHLSVGGRG